MYKDAQKNILKHVAVQEYDVAYCYCKVNDKKTLIYVGFAVASLGVTIITAVMIYYVSKKLLIERWLLYRIHSVTDQILTHFTL